MYAFALGCCTHKFFSADAKLITWRPSALTILETSKRFDRKLGMTTFGTRDDFCLHHHAPKTNCRAFIHTVNFGVHTSQRFSLHARFCC